MSSSQRLAIYMDVHTRERDSRPWFDRVKIKCYYYYCYCIYVYSYNTYLYFSVISMDVFI